MIFQYEYYFNNPNINKTIDNIYKDIDSYTNEILLSDNEETKELISSMEILLPPMEKDDKIIKGLLVSRAVDYIYSFFPNLDKYFITIANSMWGSFPHSKKADAYFYCYKNEERENWFKKQYPERANKILLPFQDADYLNEKTLYPIDLEKDIDILIISRLHKTKNIDLFLKSLIYIYKKYGKKYKCTLLVGGISQQTKDKGSVYSNLIKIAGSEEELQSYINFIKSDDSSNMFLYYSRAKITAFTSLFEGKNRCIQESLMCNTPVICFKDFNKFIRGDNPILPNGCAYYTKEFSSEAFGEKLYQVLNSNIKYNTREIALKHYGRAMIIDRIIKSIPYYIETIPNITDSNIIDNDFINNCLTEHYGSYEDFLYQHHLLSTRISAKNNVSLFLAISHLKS